MYIQPSISPGSVNEYHLRLGKQRQWLIQLADETQGVRVKVCYPLTMRAINDRLIDASCGGARYRSTTVTFDDVLVRVRHRYNTRICAVEMAVRYAALSACRKVHVKRCVDKLNKSTYPSLAPITVFVISGLQSVIY